MFWQEKKPRNTFLLNPNSLRFTDRNPNGMNHLPCTITEMSGNSLGRFVCFYGFRSARWHRRVEHGLQIALLTESKHLFLDVPAFVSIWATLPAKKTSWCLEWTKVSLWFFIVQTVLELFRLSSAQESKVGFSFVQHSSELQSSKGLRSPATPFCGLCRMI